jgi:hypothetical protein
VELYLHSPDTTSWRGAQLRHRYFTFTFTFAAMHFRTLCLPALLHGSEIWPVTLREGHSLSVFVNKVMRLFGPKKEIDRKEVTRGRGKVFNEELHNLHSSPNKYL